MRVLRATLDIEQPVFVAPCEDLRYGRSGKMTEYSIVDIALPTFVLGKSGQSNFSCLPGTGN